MSPFFYTILKNKKQKNNFFKKAKDLKLLSQK